MTDTQRISIPFAPGSFPMAELIENRVWAQIPQAAKAVLAVIWNYHRRFPASCHPSRQTIAGEAGVHPSTVSRSLDVLEAMGIVEVMPQVGPRPNHYRIKWTDITVEPKEPSQRTSPYSKPSKDWEVSLEQTERGKDVALYTRKNANFYRLPDGCLVRSAKEVVLHSFLVSWRVPHWTDVRYRDLGINLRHPKTAEFDIVSTVDFVVGPYYLLEQRGLPSHQSAAKTYKDKLRRKLKAISASRWDGYMVETQERPGSRILDLILAAWARATIEDAKTLRKQMRAAGKYKVSHEPSRWLDDMITDAEARLSGRASPRKPRGLSVMRPGPQGFPVEQMTAPELVLMESAGQEPARPESSMPLKPTTPQSSASAPVPASTRGQQRPMTLEEEVEAELALLEGDEEWCPPPSAPRPDPATISTPEPFRELTEEEAMEDALADLLYD